MIFNVAGKIKFQENMMVRDDRMVDGGPPVILKDPESIMPLHDFKDVDIINDENFREKYAESMPTAKQVCLYQQGT